MQAIKIYILEDEIVTRRLLKNQLEEYGYIVCGMADSAEIALNEINDTNPDIAILDIDVNGDKSGIWLGEQLKIPFIYLTAKSDTITIKSAVKTEPVGYLIKPFKEMDVFAIIEMTINQLEKEYLNADESIKQENIILKDGRNHLKVHINEIDYVKSDGKYIEVYLEAKRIVSRESLVGFMSKIKAPTIVRIHGSYLININKIESFNSLSVSIKNVAIPISRRYKKAFLTKVNG